MAVETVRVEGLSQALKMLNSLPAEIVSKRGGPVRAALRKAAVVLRNEAQRNVDQIIATPNKNGPDRSTGLLRKNITITRGHPSGFKGEIFMVTVKGRKRYPADLAGVRFNRVRDIAWMLEFGTERRDAMPWLRPAYDAKREESVTVFRTELFRAIDKAIKKAGL